ncbi:flagellar hook assembly protein FlgD [Roseibacterium sp. SDUM158017]|uniref:flagellar hook assembly protein FlgD n=1 Tax=Roseicyclus salinarum TaxID=3036773 RepID=UPI00241548E9|nr:flagellar hook assembly protein FlgD [Roseibacterium sp. SDUM158017]MDG4648656.1 flagellar hook assembly protein FlgD [Roseibacterium sp. SDUM158017]
MIDPTATAPASAQSSSSAALSQLGNDYQSFLKLLTAQVANQDPLAPMDSSTFVSQLAQLSQVEQSVQVNANLRDISARIAGAVAISDVQLIGRNVSLPGDQIMPSPEGTRFSYELAEPASAVAARIVAPDGTVLRSFTGLATAAGESEVAWDGNDEVGLPVVGEGPFRVEILAVDAEGKTVPHATYVSAGVESVVFRDGVPMLVLDNGMQVASSRIAMVD